jgi:hypothetical protein
MVSRARAIDEGNLSRLACVCDSKRHGRIGLGGDLARWLNARVKIGFGFLASLVVLAGLSLPGRGEDLRPTVLAKGLFSYQAPPGWTLLDSVSSKFPVAVGPRIDRFTPTLSVDIDDFSGSLDAYVKDRKNMLKRGGGRFTRVTPITRELVVTSAGLDGVRVIYRAIREGRELWLVCYYFDGGSNKMLRVTGTSLAIGGRTNGVLFDAAVKTLTLE